MDMTYMAKQQSEDVYSTFNMLVRRKVRHACSWGDVHTRPCPCHALHMLSSCLHVYAHARACVNVHPPYPRLQAKENNFKAVLESIRDLMNEDAAVPAWLHDILLGYGDPGAAQVWGGRCTRSWGAGRAWAGAEPEGATKGT